MNNRVYDSISLQIKGLADHVLVGLHKGTVKSCLRLLGCGHVDNSGQKHVSSLSCKLFNMSVRDHYGVAGLCSHGLDSLP